MTELFEQIVNIQSQYQQMQMDYWLNHNLFSGIWWLIVIINLSSLLLFIVLMDKKNILLMTLTLLISFTLIGISNEIGNYFGYWDYPYQFIPFLESFNAVDFLVIPVIISLMYQFVNGWRKYLITNLILSSLLAFIGIPISVYLNLYTLINWNVFYSFLTLFAVGCLVKIASDFIKNKSSANMT
ncbi:CBO0543 family protein [Virgibacillus oceani]